MTNEEIDIKIADAHQRICDSIDESVRLVRQAMHFNWFRIMPIDTSKVGYTKSEPTAIVGIVLYGKDGKPIAHKLKEPISYAL
jgi:hypothetical protein